MRVERSAGIDLAMSSLRPAAAAKTPPTIVELLKRQAEIIGPQTNPFDVAVRRPMHGLTRAMTTQPLA